MSTCLIKDLMVVVTAMVFLKDLYWKIFNDIGNAAPDGYLKLFVDDTNLFIFSPNITMLNRQPTTALNSWINGLLLTSWLQIDLKRVTRQFQRSVGETENSYRKYLIKEVEKYKSLGITIDKKLKLSQFCWSYLTMEEVNYLS